MELKKLTGKLYEFGNKYKYAVIVLLIGLILLLIPGKNTRSKTIVETNEPITNQQILLQESLEGILQTIQGAGKVKVLLSTEKGEETVYQTDNESTASGNQIQTVIITDAQRNDSGLIRQINPVAYKGAIVVCQGADSSSVRLAITQAVSKITGLGTDAICVLKME